MLPSIRADYCDGQPEVQGSNSPQRNDFFVQIGRVSISPTRMRRAYAAPHFGGSVAQIASRRERGEDTRKAPSSKHCNPGVFLFLFANNSTKNWLQILLMDRIASIVGGCEAKDLTKMFPGISLRWLPLNSTFWIRGSL